MPFFRKKPVVIEARQYLGTPESALLLEESFIGRGNMGGPYTDRTNIDIFTLEGTMKADSGDWIIKGVNGEFYPCKPGIFEKIYEQVEA
jgi:hypothetical protein